MLACPRFFALDMADSGEQIADITDEVAARPSRTQSGTRSIQEQPIADLLALEQYRDKKTASTTAAASQVGPFGFLSRAKIVPGGCG